MRRTVRLHWIDTRARVQVHFCMLVAVCGAEKLARRTTTQPPRHGQHALRSPKNPNGGDDDDDDGDDDYCATHNSTRSVCAAVSSSWFFQAGYVGTLGDCTDRVNTTTLPTIVSALLCFSGVCTRWRGTSFPPLFFRPLANIHVPCRSPRVPLCVYYCRENNPLFAGDQNKQPKGEAVSAVLTACVYARRLSV